MKTTRIKVGDRVEKTGSLTDYATGRQGEIIEIDQEAQRARVMWDHSPKLKTDYETGKTVRAGGVEPMSKPIRTWVNFRYLSDPLN